ncbi:MAG: hypothetical protein WBD95_02810 [Xanthobacteraceae bacterium]
MILTKQLKRLIRRRHAFVDEVIDSRLPCRHAIIRATTISMHAADAATAARSAYMIPLDKESTGEDRMAFKPNYGRDRAERARSARARSEEKQRKKDEKAAQRKAEREESAPLSEPTDPPLEEGQS